MESFRNPKFVQRYEDVSFNLQTPIKTTIANAAHQIKTGYRFVADNSGEVAPFDWYNARLETDFKVVLLADGANLGDDQNGIVNGSHSLIDEITININGIQVYNCTYANHCVNIKNLLEYDSSYANSTATNQFFYLDSSGAAEKRIAQETYNKGFAARKELIHQSETVNAETPLNRYSFFESLEDELLPNTKVEIKIKLESDTNLIWRTGGADCRVVITKLRLWVPRIIFTPEGETHYLSKYLKPHKWPYLMEVVERSSSTREQTGTFRISAAINKPRHVFVWILNDAAVGTQTINSFLYNTFNVANNQKLTSCYLEVGNGIRYPENEYLPSTEMSRIYRDVLKYVHAANDYKGGTLLNRSNFLNYFSFLYFDLKNQKKDLKDGTTKLSFHYKLTGATNADYSVYALVLHEQDIELFQSNNKLMLRA